MKNYFVLLALLVLGGVCAERTAAQNPNYIGFVDRVDCSRMSGWAADKNRPNVPINVSIFVDNNAAPLMTVAANLQREAAVGAAVGSGDNGQHGFDFGSPLRDGQLHTFTFKFETSTTLLGSNNPSSITCGAFNSGTATSKVLVVDFTLNNGAATVRNRIAGITFTVRERTDATSRDVTSEVTHYRLRESPDLRNADLSSEPWTPLPQHALIMELALRNGAGQRFGDRKVMFQVKTANLTSPVVSDTITLVPVIKEYRVSATGSGHPLIQYAASQGFGFPISFYHTCDGSCVGTISASPSLESGTASISVQASTSSGSSGPESSHTLDCGVEIIGGAALGGSAGALVGAVAGAGAGAAVGAPVGAALGAGVGGLTCVLTGLPQSAPSANGTCTTKADYFLFEDRSPNQFWTVKSVQVPDAFVRFHGANRFLVKVIVEKKDATCVGPRTIAIGDVVVEGPEDDDFVDAANPWKNAFVQPRLLIKPSIPIIRPH